MGEFGIPEDLVVNHVVLCTTCIEKGKRKPTPPPPPPPPPLTRGMQLPCIVSSDDDDDGDDDDVVDVYDDDIEEGEVEAGEIYMKSGSITANTCNTVPLKSNLLISPHPSAAPTMTAAVSSKKVKNIVPPTMVWSRKDEDSVWYNQQGILLVFRSPSYNFFPTLK